MPKFISTFLFSCLLFLTGCNGLSGENTTDSEDTVITSIQLQLTNSTNVEKTSFSSNEVITVKVLVLNQDSRPVTGALINLSADIATLSPATKITDAEGYAIVHITNSTLTIGAGTVTAVVDELSTSLFYEFIDSETAIVTGSNNNKMALELLLDGTAVNQFNTTQEVQLSATLTDPSGNPINDEIITFTADIGTLTASTALTVNGVANVTLSSTDIAIGAGVITATATPTVNGLFTTDRGNYEILASNVQVINSTVRIGYFDEMNTFVEGQAKLSLTNNTISAGGTVGISIDLADSDNERIDSPAEIIFTSSCVANNHATIDSSIFSIKGNAQATFEDINCAGTSGIDDVLIASVTLNGLTSTASATLHISGEDLGSIEFISAQPATVVLQGSGGQETSTLSFMVKSALGNPLAQQEVTFSLNTNVGGINLSKTSGLTNSQGLITTQVNAGTVPTAVRVTASATMSTDSTVQTQSDLLSVSTGLPEQRSMTIAASPLNPEADNNGEESTISVWLADNFNNPSPDGTTVNFTTEGGVIVPSCTTVKGHCSVTWTSSEPRVVDHKVTILATAVGHETFFDTNGNNTFDAEDGNAITGIDIKDRIDSGFNRYYAESNGFIDMSEAWRDDNNDNEYNDGEVYLDFNNDNEFSPEDTKFNGPICEGSHCPTAGQNSLHIRKALTLIMSSSAATYTLIDADSGTIYADNANNQSSPIANIIDTSAVNFILNYGDTAQQALPMGTQVTVTSSVGKLLGDTTTSILNTNQSGSLEFSIINDDSVTADTGQLKVTISTPKGTITTLYKTVTLL